MRFGLRSWIPAVLLSIGLHAAAASLFLSEEEDEKVAGGHTIEIAMLGESAFDALAAGNPDEIVEPVEPQTQSNPVENTEAAIEPVPAKSERPADSITESTVQPEQAAEILPEASIQPDSPSESSPDPVRKTLAPDTSQVPEMRPMSEPVETVSLSPQTDHQVPDPIQAVVLPDVVPDNNEAAIVAIKQSEQVPATPIEQVPTTTIEQVPETPVKEVEAKPDSQSEYRPEVLPPLIARTVTTTEPRDSAIPPEKTVKAPVKKPKRVVKAAKTIKKQRVKGKKGKNKGNSRKGDDRGDKKGKSTRNKSNATRVAKASGNANISNYKGKLRRKINRRFRPGRVRDARRDVVVRFVVGRNGQVKSVSVVRSSGSSRLDAAALNAVRRAAPFPPLPKTVSKSNLTVIVPMNVRG